MLDRAEMFKVIGIVSWGVGCARPGVYGVYTQVESKLHIFKLSHQSHFQPTYHGLPLHWQIMRASWSLLAIFLVFSGYGSSEDLVFLSARIIHYLLYLYSFIYKMAFVIQSNQYISQIQVLFVILYKGQPWPSWIQVLCSSSWIVYNLSL